MKIPNRKLEISKKVEPTLHAVGFLQKKVYYKELFTDENIFSEHERKRAEQTGPAVRTQFD